MSDPRTARFIEWDEHNEEKLAHHGISTVEVEQLWSNRPVVLPNKRGRSGDYKLVGRTDGGRSLTVIIKHYPSRQAIRPITGWDSPKSDVTRYRR